ncbi:amidase [Hydrogenophaga palleronii]|uniref:amidase n=1 Tax=Hydrogenophaga palleronii TaxID=65655 RepID=UPI00082630E1|nr:amidase [Hydrogenophaga palleronii]
MNTATRAPLWQLDACDLGEAYRTAATTPLAVLDAHLTRLAMVQPVINALAWLDADGARRAAEASTKRWHQGRPLSALDGVPVTVKDNIPLAGLPCRWGSRLWQDHLPEADESPVARLRAAGAVFLGKTAVPEFTLQGYTGSPVTGVTRNPWDPALTPGGSSGGAVAALAAGVGVLALATDGGGSIRRPAGHTGLYGFKPGWDVVPREHGLPEVLPGMEVIGAVTRRARDLPLAMDVIGSAGTWHAAGVPPRRQRIAYWRHIAGSPVDADVLARCDDAAQRLRALGHAVEEADAPATIQAFNQQAWPVISTTGLAHVLRDHPRAAGELSPALAAMWSAGQAWRATDLFEAQAVVRRLVRTLAGVFSAHDLVLTPCSAALPWPAAESHPPVIAAQPVDGRGHAVFTAFANASGLPALALPAGLAGHLPVGVQLVGPVESDALLLALALEWEQAGGSTTEWPLWP